MSASRFEEMKARRALEEARKAGEAPALVDEDGRTINPHIPMYIAQAPWYLDMGHPTLKHQRQSEKKETESDLAWHQRVTAAPTKKYRKGACENCGAVSHKTRDCVERPRKTGAKWTNKDIKADEYIEHVDLSYQGKRDRWNGYDPATHKQIIEEWELVEETRRKIKEKQLEEEMMAAQKKRDEAVEKETLDIGDLSDSDDEAGADAAALNDDGDKYVDNQDMPGQKVDPKQRMTVRNLRLREDTAKYLLNLDADSAYYDPKTRSMRENPLPDKKAEDLNFAGDNFVRWTGETTKLADMQMFAWAAHDRGINVNLNADPTRAAMMHKEYQKTKTAAQDEHKKAIIDKYGGEEHLKAPPKELLMAQTEHYIEYSRTGDVVKGPERAQARSKYEEDHVEKYGSGHTSVFGSYFDADQHKWGYACCRSTFRASYCTGSAGLEASKMKPTASDVSNQPAKSLKEQHVERLIDQMKQDKAGKRKRDTNE